MKFFKTAACILCATSLTAHAEVPDGAEFAFVIKIFEKIQDQSFAENRELCGYLGYGPEDELMITRISRGEEASCYLPTWPAKMDVIASFHTHSTYNPDYNSELPSSTDMESDEDSGIDGWVATPGGRLWYIDSSEMMAYQVCGAGCLPQDPDFVDEPAGAIKPSYTYRGILKSESQ